MKKHNQQCVPSSKAVLACGMQHVPIRLAAAHVANHRRCPCRPSYCPTERSRVICGGDLPFPCSSVPNMAQRVLMV